MSDLVLVPYYGGDGSRDYRYRVCARSAVPETLTVVALPAHLAGAAIGDDFDAEGVTSPLK